MGLHDPGSPPATVGPTHDDESHGVLRAAARAHDTTPHGPTATQALLTVAVLAEATYLGAMHILASEACAAIYVASLGYVYRDIRRSTETS